MTRGTVEHLGIDVGATARANSCGAAMNADHAPVAETPAGGCDCSSFLARDIVADIWRRLSLPQDALQSLNLPGDDASPALPCSFKIGILAQSTAALSGLLAALMYATRNNVDVPEVTVDQKHAVVEVQAERLHVLDGRPVSSPRGPIGGPHRTSDGYVRIHDSLPNHRAGTLKLLGQPSSATFADISSKTADWVSIELETVGLDHDLAIYALRSY